MSDPHKRLHTLLTDRAISGLDAKDRAEFEHLRAGAAIDPTYEAAAAAIDLALLAHVEPLPDSVRGTILGQAAQHFGFLPIEPSAPEPAPEPTVVDVEQDFGEDDFGDELVLGEEGAVLRRTWEQSPRAGLIDDALETAVLESSLTDGRVDRSVSPADSQRNEIVPRLERRSSTKKPSGPRPNRRRTDRQDDGEEPERKRPTAPDPSESEEGSTIVRMPVSESKLARVATYVSAAAALTMLVVALWLYAARDDRHDPDAVYDRLGRADDMIEWTFRPEQDEAVGEGAGGSVRWSAELQQGVVVLSGLAVNDPSQSQYQIWIIDKHREGPPVPAAAFDVEAEGELRVAFDPALVIAEPSAFVITVERPGGMVVSERDRVVMIAAASRE